MNIIDNLIKIMNAKGITAYQLERDISINQTNYTNKKNNKIK